MGLLPRGARRDRGRDPARRRGRARGEPGAAARAALHAHGDDLPGADDRAQSGHALRRPDRRGAGHPHAGSPRPRGARRCWRSSRAVRLPDPVRMIAVVPAPALRRPAAAHHDRDGAGARARAAHRRRADHRARRDHAGADPRAHPRADARARHRRAVHHARLRRRGRDRRSRRGPAAGRDRRDGPGASRCCALRSTTTRRCSSRSVPSLVPPTRATPVSGPVVVRAEGWRKTYAQRSGSGRRATRSRRPRTCRSRSAAARRSASSASRAPARRRSRAASRG